MIEMQTKKIIIIRFCLRFFYYLRTISSYLIGAKQ